MQRQAVHDEVVRAFLEREHLGVGHRQRRGEAAFGKDLGPERGARADDGGGAKRPVNLGEPF